MQDNWTMLGTIFADSIWSVFYHYYEYNRFEVLHISGLNGVEVNNPSDVRVYLINVWFSDNHDEGKKDLLLEINHGQRRRYENQGILDESWMNKNPYHQNTANVIFSFLLEMNCVFLIDAYKQFNKRRYSNDDSRDCKKWLNNIYGLNLDSPLTFREFISSREGITIYPLSKHDTIPEEIKENDISHFFESLHSLSYIFAGYGCLRSKKDKVETLQYAFRLIENKYIPSKTDIGLIVKLYGRVFHFDCNDNKWRQLITNKQPKRR